MSDSKYKFVAIGSQCNDAGESAISVRLTNTRPYYEMSSVEQQPRTPFKPQPLVTMCAESVSVIQVWLDDKLIEYRFFTMWDEGAWTNLPYASVLADDDGEEKGIKELEVNMNMEAELAYRGSKMQRIATLQIPAGKSEIFITDVCLVTHQSNEDTRPIQWNTVTHPDNGLYKLPIEASNESRTIGLYSVDDADYHNTVEYRLIFDVYPGVNEKFDPVGCL